MAWSCCLLWHECFSRFFYRTSQLWSRSEKFRSRGVLLENQLIPENMKPHIVISSYSTNNSLNPDLNASLYNQQNFLSMPHTIFDLVMKICLLSSLPTTCMAYSSYQPLWNRREGSTGCRVGTILWPSCSNVAQHNAVTNYVNLMLPNLQRGRLWNIPCGCHARGDCRCHQ
jgi:hypothetical protein